MLQIRILAHSRGVSGDDPEGGAGSGVLRRRLVTVRPGRPGTPPARHYDLAARSSLHGSGRQLPAVVGRRAPKETEARPRGPKPPRWSAERRASRVMGRKAPRKRLACRDTARPTGARWHPNVSRRSASLSSKLMNSLINSGRCAAIPGFFPVCIVTPAQTVAHANSTRWRLLNRLAHI